MGTRSPDMMKAIKIGLAAAVVVVVAAGLWWYWDYSAAHPSTDDAYLQADILTIVPQVPGRVATVAVTEDQHVSAGDVLFSLETSDFEAQRDIAKAQLLQADQTTDVSGANVAAAQAQVVQAQATENEAVTTYERQRSLFEQGDVAQAALDQATTARDQASGARAAADAALDSARSADTSPDGVSAARLSAEAAVRLAELNLARTEITAPADGWVSNISLRPGDYVATGQPLFSLVEDADWWVDANFKETDLERIRPGQPVSLSIDMYSGAAMTGTVASIGAGSGAAFSLLPAQNATGNWVKVTQRFPVRIALDGPPADPALRLRVGTSVTATVDTTAPPDPVE